MVETNKYVDWDRSGIEESLPLLQVEKRLSRLEAFALARTLVTPEAKKAMFIVHQHLEKIQVAKKIRIDNKQEKYPSVLYALFPFKGRTKLYVSGKRICLSPTERSPQWAVFAMAIERCSFPSTFSDIIVKSDAPWDENAPADKTEGHGGRETEPFSPDTEKHNVDDGPANQNLVRAQFKNHSNRFAAFDRVEFEHRRPPGGRQHGRPPLPGEVAIDGLTVNDGDFSGEASGTLGVSEFDSHVYDAEAQLGLFTKAITHLETLPATKDWKFETRTICEQHALTVFGKRVSHFPEKILGSRTWHLIQGPNGEIRPRLVIFAEIAIKNNFLYICEMEIKKKGNQCTIELFRTDFAKLREKALKKLLQLTASRKRWPEKFKKNYRTKQDEDQATAFFMDHTIIRTHHPRKPISPADWAIVLFESIEEGVKPYIQS